MLFPISATATVDATSPDYDTIATVYPGGGYQTCVLRISSAAGSAALTDFRMSVMAHKEDADFEPFIGGDDWAAGSNASMIYCGSTTPKTLAAGADTMIKVNIHGFFAVRFEANVAADSAEITVKGQCV
jgi:hypothetical protein